MATGPDGFVYFTLAGATRVGRISPAGTLSSDAAGVNGLEDIVAGPDGRVWFTENANNKILAYDGTPPAPSFAPFSAGSGPSGIAAGPDGNLWVTESAPGPSPNGNAIAVVDPANANSPAVEHPIPTAASVPSGIAAGPDGNLWFAEKSAGKIGRITPGGIITEFPLPASGDQPTSIVAGPDGNMWFTRSNGSGIGRINPSAANPASTIQTFSAGANPTGITVGPDANIWFTGRNGNFIGRATTDLETPRYTNGDAVTIADQGQAGIYPSLIEASGLPGKVTEVSVRFNGIVHPDVTDIEALLVGPEGQKVRLLADYAPGGSAVRDIGTGQVITLDDDGLTAPGKLVSGIFKPIIGSGGSTFPTPAPVPPYASQLSAFDGTNPNGTWSLFVQDDTTGPTGPGVITCGWSLDIQTAPDPVTVPGPTVQVPVPGPVITVPGPTTTIQGPPTTVQGPPVVVTPPADTTKPTLRLGTLAASMPQATFRKGFSLAVTPSEAVTLDVTMTLKPKNATLAAADDLLVFDRTLSATRATALALKPSAKYLGRPRKSFAVVLRIVATDKGGNRATATKTITVDPGKKKRRR
jgi:streptogramin lyase